MSKSFRDTYDIDNFGTKRINKSHKQKRQKVKDYLRQIDTDNIPDDEDFDEFNETLEDEKQI